MNYSMRFIDDCFRGAIDYLPPNFFIQQDMAVNSPNDPTRRKIMNAMVQPDPKTVEAMLRPDTNMPDYDKLLSFIDKIATNIKKGELETSGILQTRMQLAKIMGTNPLVGQKSIAKHLEANTGNVLVFYPFDTSKAASILFANNGKHVFSYLKDQKIVEVKLGEDFEIEVTPVDESTILKVNPEMRDDLKNLFLNVIQEQFKMLIEEYGEFNLYDNEKAIKAMNKVIKPYVSEFSNEDDISRLEIPFPDGKNNKKIAFYLDENREIKSIEVLPILIRPADFKDMNMFTKTVHIN